jgi:hypothetical protein
MADEQEESFDTLISMDYMRASEFARKFNEALDKLVDHFPEEHHDWIRKLPRIYFLEPMVVEAVADDQEYNFLIEKMLEGK